MKFFYSLMLFMAFISSPANALDYEHHLGLGLNIDTFKDDLPPNLDLRNDIALAPALGYKGVILWGNVGIRTGAFFEWKKVDVENSAAGPSDDDIDLTAYYAAIPINLQFNLNQAWSFFGGITPRVLLAKTCDNCGSFDDDSKYLTNYANGGISYKFGNTFSMDAIINHALGENFEDLKINTAQVLFFWEI